ncbi:hypothetical protein BN79_027 [Yersinia phage phiR2-01]|uniref:Uncharacterized protein n=1 Tax=Yersinia phage phiR2-01 TaxID=1206557 RepID=I7KQS5_9CAUD|nr:hypothetical protein BN79_027 [Yersinia phage phiR2-01]CCI88455.1 hypothetical protein BN79_027 [Yersinia phage phiR2-01]
MEREFNRYYVIKASHAKEALTKEEQDTLLRLGMKCAKWRSEVGKTPFECLVVEHDWPEYEKVWDMLEKRVDGEDMANSEYNRGWDNAIMHYEREGSVPFLQGITSYCQGWNACANDFMR